jgi:transposase
MARSRRSFPADFKAQIVLQLLTGAATQAELCRKHDLKPQLLGYWKTAMIVREGSVIPGLFA